MPALLLLGLLVATLCPAVLCHPVATAVPQDARREDTADATRLVGLVSSNADFACSLYKQLALLNQDKNIIFSPLSISTALAFLALGARGSTLTELLQGLKFNLTEMPEKEIHQGFRQLLLTLRQPQEQLQLNLGNALFVGLKLLPDFEKGAQELYAAEAFDTNFQDLDAAKKLINDYVAEKTQGKIVDLFDSLDDDTVMVLVNFLLFKAHWKEPFNTRATSRNRFYLKKDKWVDVPMMFKNNLNTPYFRDDELSCTVVQLNYVGNASAFFILPDEDKMQEVEASLSLETLRRWRDSVKTTWITQLRLPKFSISGEFNLKDVLPHLGIREVFTNLANFSGITEEKNIKISKAVHKAVLDVAETGTEAAAATTYGSIAGYAFFGPRTIVHFDRPFLIAIVSTDPPSILFLSKVTNPLQA
ncbi:alpha-1-antichymotrypsin-like [Ochotona curzoniae]|uniref:alpha-1-antichymotrypsin-like n=1 Tax=Ochotona curzoniae TaxID=130825 RepID=UPI001B3485EF|nr:alpha-1-antichymotrypsin-like [Ochotona curzoniae]